MRIRSWGGIAVAAIVAVSLTACGDSTSPLPGSGQNVSLSFSGVRPAGISGAMTVLSGTGDTMVLASGEDTLRITSIEVVLREIELERASASVSCDSTLDADACEEISLGPQLVSLPLVPGVSAALTAPIDSGSYRKVKFDVHKPGGDALDQAFIAAHPEFATISIRVRGTFNGTPFTYTSALDEEQEFTFDPPFVVDASGASTSLTVRLDVSLWFRQSGSGALIDPATANVGGVNEGVVQENIKNSIKAFEDHDRDGDERDG